MPGDRVPGQRHLRNVSPPRRRCPPPGCPRRPEHPHLVAVPRVTASAPAPPSVITTSRGPAASSARAASAGSRPDGARPAVLLVAFSTSTAPASRRRRRAVGVRVGRGQRRDARRDRPRPRGRPAAARRTAPARRSRPAPRRRQGPSVSARCPPGPRTPTIPTREESWVAAPSCPTSANPRIVRSGPAGHPPHVLTPMPSRWSRTGHRAG